MITSKIAELIVSEQLAHFFQKQGDNTLLLGVWDIPDICVCPLHGIDFPYISSSVHSRKPSFACLLPYSNVFHNMGDVVTNTSTDNNTS